ncbi:hypothetical protein [Shouchella clausii]|uniref:hypothetical protein n=1 Tax=Shouchella clausii TaxID=79880 RepID=UPI000BA74EBB|nr:hypothetical protein [Shouchella clausii]PAD91633.1 hypothetical protein CHH52_13495 [Shouchella clausii]
MDKEHRQQLAKKQITSITGIERKLLELNRLLPGAEDFLDDERWAAKKNIIFTLGYAYNCATMDAVLEHVAGRMSFDEMVVELEKWGACDE